MQQYKSAIIAHIGPMFGGKTSGLLSDVRKLRIAECNVAVFKPFQDTRDSIDEVVSHDGLKTKAINVKGIDDILVYINTHPEIDAIAVNEFQMINSIVDPKVIIKALVTVVLNRQLTFIVSGLVLDSDLNPFENMKELLPYCSDIQMHKAVCKVCHEDATVSYCKIKKDTQELLGGEDIYEPRCYSCFQDK